jgi:hypothetical protein
MKPGPIADMLSLEEDEETRYGKIRETLVFLRGRANDVATDVVNLLNSDTRLPEIFYKDIFTLDELPISVVEHPLTKVLQNLMKEEKNEQEFKKWLDVLLGWSQSTYAKLVATRINSLSEYEGLNSSKLTELLLNKKLRILRNLFREDDVDSRSHLLKFLIDVPRTPGTDTRLRVSGILEDSIHATEHWTDWGTRILELANTINPVIPAKNEETIYVDTAYLLNWCCSNGYFCSNIDDISHPVCPGKKKIRDWINRLCDRIIEGSPDLNCFKDLVDYNCAVDILMFLPGYKRYRGHDFHQFNVAILGLFFLQTHLKSGQLLGEYIAKIHQEKFGSKTDVEKTWLLESLLHDHALPISDIFKTAPLIRKILNAGGIRGNKPRSLILLNETEKKKEHRKKDPLEELQKNWLLIWGNLFSPRLKNAYKEFVKEDKEHRSDALKKLITKELPNIELGGLTQRELDHGVLGAANMLSLFGRPKSESTKIVENSANDIALHNLKDHQIRFKEDPLAFLLVLCDELQEWGREIADFPQILLEAVSMTLGEFHFESGDRFFKDSLTVSYKFFENKEVPFHSRVFIEGKRRIFKRLRFDDTSAFPRIKFDAKNTGTI